MKNIILYYKDRYEEENSRFNYMETKCSLILRFLTIVIAAIGTIVSLNKAILSPATFLEWFKFSIFIVGSISIILSWYHALVSLKIGDFPTMPKGRKTYDYLRMIDDKKREQHYLNCYMDTIEKLSDTIDNKTIFVKYAYNELSIGAVLFGILTIISVISEVIK